MTPEQPRPCQFCMAMAQCIYPDCYTAKPTTLTDAFAVAVKAARLAGVHEGMLRAAGIADRFQREAEAVDTDDDTAASIYFGRAQASKEIACAIRSESEDRSRQEKTTTKEAK